ncbi:prepilin-type N-terminal cleavage/methylation domain-containing protein [Clostridium bowmanii]|uniref:prepilin-type N-terminal cleavage/methylation domain-containing protein n=1 Tax=Clostridium bowmanii TaxID=132925 RepID=UPI001C0CDDC1|nr:prepilin-type N-terminal cleavage/methylation domain-containing protein [Clostridium bowmanii]MBU3189475.1 prepilin-type N-terminal cleavage/methylation domain-containing protein [Clostridium bowmanii]
MKNVKKKKGFTLIELIIVISIIAVLAAIAVPKYGEIQKDAKIKADIASAKVIADATVALIAQEKITKSAYTSAAVLGDDIKGYLQTVPVTKAVKDGVFKVQIDASDNVVVTVLSTNPAGTFTLYPTTTPLVYPTPPVAPVAPVAPVTN